MSSIRPPLAFADEGTLNENVLVVRCTISSLVCSLEQGRKEETTLTDFKLLLSD